MRFPTPEDVKAKAQRAYVQFLKAWVSGNERDFFPYRVRTRLSLDAKDLKGTTRAIESLMAKSKNTRGCGYTVHREIKRTREFGTNLVPQKITIDTLEDLLHLTNKKAEFKATCRVIEEVRAAFPRLEEWLGENVRTLHRHVDLVSGQILVAQFFVAHPWPDCYARQIPVPVDTKFVQRHRAPLRQWLDQLLPASAIDVNEKNFYRRFGLRDGQQHRAIRVLDPQLTNELRLPFDELSLPLRSMATLPVKNATVVIVENRLNLLTLPPMVRGLGVRGEGNAVNRLEQLRWLDANRVLYWGDIDVEGFLILSRLRNLFGHVESVLMDMSTLREHESLLINGTGSNAEVPTNLTPGEAEAFEHCRKENRRLEQESIPQVYVDQKLA